MVEDVPRDTWDSSKFTIGSSILRWANMVGLMGIGRKSWAGMGWLVIVLADSRCDERAVNFSLISVALSVHQFCSNFRFGPAQRLSPALHFDASVISFFAIFVTLFWHVVCIVLSLIRAVVTCDSTFCGVVEFGVNGIAENGRDGLGRK